MSSAAWLTKGAVWLALLSFALSEARSARWRTARWLSTLGLGFFLTHVGLAFAYYYHWSPAIAYRETAMQTAARVGVSWGGGLSFNYLFALWWIEEELWKWCAPGAFIGRSPAWGWAWRGFFWFMAINGTVVFGSGPARWAGAVWCLALAAIWWRRRVEPATVA